jgi:hypothetical protein
MKWANQRSVTEARAARMMMPGEVKVLAYLRKHGWATVADVTSACLAGTPKELVSRILGNLDWLGYVTVYPGPGGTTAALQITQTGMAAASGPALCPLPSPPAKVYTGG